MTEKLLSEKSEKVAIDNDNFLLLVGNCSYTLVFDKTFISDCLDSPGKVIVEKRKEGLLIRKDGV